MKLYYSPGACSLRYTLPCARQTYQFELDKVDLGERQPPAAKTITKSTPRATCPHLRLDDGEVLTEDAVLLQYVADQNLTPAGAAAGQHGTLPADGMAQFHFHEIHKTLGALFNPKVTPEWRDNQVALFGRRATGWSRKLGDQHFLMGEHVQRGGWLSVYRAPLVQAAQIDTSNWPVLNDLQRTDRERPAVVAAMKAEGLIEAKEG